MKIFYDRRTSNWHQVIDLSYDGVSCRSGGVVIPQAGDIVLQRFSGTLMLWSHAIPEALEITSTYLAMNSDYNTFTLG